MSHYESYYLNQAGAGGMPYFSGPRYQKGYGLGSIFSGLLRAAMPILKSAGAKSLGQTALKTGAQVFSDVIQGKKFGDSLKNRAGEAVGTFAQRLNAPQQRKRKASRPSSARGIARARRRKKLRSLDIFT